MSFDVTIEDMDAPNMTAGFNVTKVELREKVEEYISAISTSKTTDFCSGKWYVHPEDVDKPAGERRMMNACEDEICPLHTTEGRILYFFTWLSEHA